MTITERKKLLKDAIATAKIYRSLVKKIEDPKTKVSVLEGITLNNYLRSTETFLQAQTDLLDVTSPKGEDDMQRFEESNGVWRYAWGNADEYAPVNLDEEEMCCRCDEECKCCAVAPCKAEED